MSNNHSLSQKRVTPAQKEPLLPPELKHISFPGGAPPTPVTWVLSSSSLIQVRRMVYKCGPAQLCLSSQAPGSICRTDPKCQPYYDDPARPPPSTALLNHLQSSAGSPEPFNNPDS